MTGVASSPQRSCHHITCSAQAGWAAAVAWQATELVLLKSCDLGETTELSVLAEQGLVDRYFETAAIGLGDLSWMNLRSLERRELRVTGRT